MPEPQLSHEHFQIGFRTLLRKEIQRFCKVMLQTILAPVLSALLFLLIFSHVLGQRMSDYGNIDYAAFLVPGLVMMALLQNAFANSSSSLLQSKITGDILFILLAPLSHQSFYSAYVLASILRGLCVGLGVLLVSQLLVRVPLEHPLWVITFAVLGGASLGSFGLIAAIWAEKFDQLAVFQNFLIMPLTMLSGVFYSVHSLPPFWSGVSHLNPFFYLIDGFRYGFFGYADVSPWLSLAVIVVFFVMLLALTLAMLARGYRLRG